MKNNTTLSIENIPCILGNFRFDGCQFTLVSASRAFFDLIGINESAYFDMQKNTRGFRFCSESSSEEIFLKFVDELRENRDFSTEFRMEGTDGRTIWVQTQLHLFSLDEGIYTYTLAGIDITALKAKELEVMGESERLLTIASLSADVIFEYNIIDDVVKFSTKAQNFKDFVEVKDFESEFKAKKIIFEDDLETFERFCDSLRLGKSKINYELRLYSNTFDEYRWFKIKAQSICNDEGKPYIVIGKIVNISDHKNAERRLIDKAERDPLTKIYNKSTTRSLIKDYLHTDSREIYDAFIIVDVDNFKSVNDNLGHLFGDSILIDLSQEMQDLFRSSDVVGRIGGDEFLLFLRGIKNKKHIEDKANDICRIFELLYSGENGDTITGSLGISLFPNDGDTFDELFKKADTALYTSKQSGKNCYTFYTPETEGALNDDNQIHSNRYKSDMAITPTNNYFDMEITDFAFDIMDKIKDVSSAINMLLSKVGKHFNLGTVGVYEVMGDNDYIKCTYQWCSQGVEANLDKTRLLSTGEIEKICEDYDDNDIVSIDDSQKLKKEYNYFNADFFSRNKIRAMIDCAIYDSGNYKGSIRFTMTSKKHVWSFDEVKTQKTISKIISSYLLKMRAYENASLMIDRLTNFDVLTNLPKLDKFTSIVNEIYDNSNVDDKFAIFYSDINNFKFVNEKFGPENGDRILKTFAMRLTMLNNMGNINCRVFSDKFITFVKFNGEQKVILNEFLKLMDDFSSGEHKANENCNITMCAGVSFFNRTDVFDLNLEINNANIARRRSKRFVKNSCLVFNEAMKEEINHSIEVVSNAEKAITNKEFVVYFQPKVELKTNTVVGVEALVRWRKSDGTLIPPDSFIPHLEKTGYITNMDFYVYEEVCKYIRNKLDAGKEVVPISLNASPVHLKNPDFVSKVQRLVNKYNIPHELLEFELTENVFLEDQQNAVNVINELKQLGFTVSIDDFGSGFSSLNLLKNIPVDILKLDKEFFSNDSIGGNDEIVISSIISMANKMRIAVICEGIETQEQIDFLRSTDCDMVQGYYFARPRPSEDFDADMKITDKK